MSECKSNFNGKSRFVRFVALDSAQGGGTSGGDSLTFMSGVSFFIISQSVAFFETATSVTLSGLDQGELSFVGPVPSIQVTSGQTIRFGFSAFYSTTSSLPSQAQAAVFFTPALSSTPQIIPGSTIQLTKGELGTLSEMGPFDVADGGAVTVGFWKSGPGNINANPAQFSLGVVVV